MMFPPGLLFKCVFKKEDKKDPSAKGADVLSATPTLAHLVRRKFEAAQPSSTRKASLNPHRTPEKWFSFPSSGFAQDVLTSALPTGRGRF
ncbi:hypothetical protein J8TS2_24640 [Lederbergia ruris]|uniref:Uncharacterized protein n=1 Tax=Lederbergia ruris TaxID=217495 RepID=A0ABQ4KJL0_9BACI|nr:hypothetical protein J8TS2_24640 [Lederbergia ruris]